MFITSKELYIYTGYKLVANYTCRSCDVNKATITVFCISHCYDKKSFDRFPIGSHKTHNQLFFKNDTSYRASGQWRNGMRDKRFVILLTWRFFKHLVNWGRYYSITNMRSGNAAAMTPCSRRLSENYGKVRTFLTPL